jgi:hypothetical protein
MATDPRASVAVWLMSGSHNSDADYERYVASLSDLREQAKQNGHGTGLLIAERDNPPPNAAWRRRMAEASSDYPPNCVYVLVSPSVVVRGIVTAINWLRPATYEFSTVSTLEDGLTWLRAKRDASTVAVVERLVAAVTAEARSQSARSAAGRR